MVRGGAERVVHAVRHRLAPGAQDFPATTRTRCPPSARLKLSAKRDVGAASRPTGNPGSRRRRSRRSTPSRGVAHHARRPGSRRRRSLSRTRCRWPRQARPGRGRAAGTDRRDGGPRRGGEDRPPRDDVQFAARLLLHVPDPGSPVPGRDFHGFPPAWSGQVRHLALPRHRADDPHVLQPLPAASTVCTRLLRGDVQIHNGLLVRAHDVPSSSLRVRTARCHRVRSDQIVAAVSATPYRPPCPLISRST